MSKTLWELAAGEQQLHKQDVIYHGPDGSNVGGKAYVTTQRVLFEPKWEASAKALVTRAVSANTVGVWMHTEHGGLLTIPREQITGVEVSKKMLKKKATLTLADGSVHVFDAGALNIDNFANAVKG